MMNRTMGNAVIDYDLLAKEIRALDESGIEVVRNEPLASYTTWRIGGPAALLVGLDIAALPTLEIIREVLKQCAASGAPVFIMGGGSNLLVPDEGFDGVVLCLRAPASVGTIEPGDHDAAVHVNADTRLRDIVAYGVEHGLTGVERLAGIPGTLGGALAMNAGTATHFIDELVHDVTIISLPHAEIRTLTRDEIVWSYRSSSLRDTALILSAQLHFAAREDPAELRARIADAHAQRAHTQPLNLPNAGSVFRNPAGESAGRLIEAVELKGTTCGGAQISDVHANFIVNRGGATAADVLELIELVQRRVAQEYGVELQTEVRVLGAQAPR